MTTQSLMFESGIKIVDGPSIWRMALSLFEGKKVSFKVEARAGRTLSGVMEANILSISRGSDPKASDWVVSGFWEAKSRSKKKQDTFTVYYHVDKRKGFIVKNSGMGRFVPA